MLKVQVEEGGTTTTYRFLVIDAHSHVGKDVDHAEMMNPNAPNGTYDFWTKTEYMIQNLWNEGKSEKSFTTVIGGKRLKLTFDFETHPFIQKLYQAMVKINPAHQGYLDRLSHQKFIDMGVMFPFQDVWRDKMPEALYHASNINVHRTVSRFPTSLRTIGYMRCDPTEGQKALWEMEYVHSNLRIRGMKLHPRSEGWIDKIVSQNAVECLAKAAEFNWPVIFDTRGKQSILDISNLFEQTRNYLKSKAPHLLPRLKVIIAHFAQGNVGDEEVYRAITKPGVYGDLSMLHGKGAGLFLADYRKWFHQNNIKKKHTELYNDPRDWSEYLLFASDYPYFGPQHAQGLLVYLFNKEFFDSGGTLQDSANIMGLNQLRLLPEYCEPFISSSKKTGSAIIQAPSMLSNSSLSALPNELKGATLSELRYLSLAKMIEEKKMNIEKFILKTGPKFETNVEDCLMIASFEQTQNPELLPIVVRNLIKNKLDFIGILPEGAQWSHDSFERFSEPLTRIPYAKMFAQSFPAKIPSEAADMISKSAGQA